MLRMSWAALLGLLVVIPALAAEDTLPAGKWKVILLGEKRETAWLVSIEQKEGKWTGKISDTAEGAPQVTLDNVAVDKERLTFDLATGRATFNFIGKLPKGSARQIYGTLMREGKVATLMLLDSTQITSFADFPKETIANAQPGDAEVFDLVVGPLNGAQENKAKLEDVRGWAEKAFKCAEPFGPHWQREIAMRCADALLTQKGFEAPALDNVRRAERLLDPKDDAELQLRVYQTLVKALKAAGKTDDVKEYETKIHKLDEQFEIEYSKKMIDFTPDPFKGRKEKSDRVVLVELFTGSECPPCVGADLGFEVLGKTFKASEVILLQYHLHIPRPDPLTSPTTESRQSYYDNEIEGTPTILFNGKATAGGGGGKANAKKKYEEYRAVIEPLLEKPSLAKLKATATMKDGKISITAEASDLEKTGEEVRLRLVLVEERVRYGGGNGVLLHHHVVRDMPGGAEGLALKEKTGKQTASVEIEELRKQTTKYLDGLRNVNFPTRPLDYKKLLVVAFVQNDKTKEIMQATQVEVEEK